jgi:predicted GIY-YIG superfamily endonuclease
MRKSGIYYLVDYDEECRVKVMYVGRTLDLARRIREHQWRQEIAFSDVFFDECKEEELFEREAEAIKEFKPILNEHIGGGN